MLYPQRIPNRQNYFLETRVKTRGKAFVFVHNFRSCALNCFKTRGGHASQRDDLES